MTKDYKITYATKNVEFRYVVIRAETEKEAYDQFFDLLLDGHSVGYCKTECLTLEETVIQ